MINKIGLDKMAFNMNERPSGDRKPVDLKTALQAPAGISVTERFAKIVNLLKASDVASEDNGKIASIAESIANKSYRIDFSSLAYKLAQSGLVYPRKNNE